LIINNDAFSLDTQRQHQTCDVRETVTCGYCCFFFWGCRVWRWQPWDARAVSSVAMMSHVWLILSLQHPLKLSIIPDTSVVDVLRFPSLYFPVTIKFSRPCLLVTWPRKYICIWQLSTLACCCSLYTCLY